MYAYVLYRRVQMTISGWTVLLAWSKAFTNARFSAALICMIFLLTAARLIQEHQEREKEVAEVRQVKRLWNAHKTSFISLTTREICLEFLGDQCPVAYPQRSSGRSLVQSYHVDIAHSCSHWNCHCTDKCGWKTSSATVHGRHAQSKGTGVRGAGCLQQWTCTDLFLCWSHTHHLLPQ